MTHRIIPSNARNERAYSGIPRMFRKMAKFHAEGSSRIIPRAAQSASAAITIPTADKASSQTASPTPATNSPVSAFAINRKIAIVTSKGR